jgi:hypothetical protein
MRNSGMPVAIPVGLDKTVPHNYQPPTTTNLTQVYDVG